MEVRASLGLFLLLSVGVCVSQKAKESRSWEVIFEGNYQFSAAELSAEFAKCPFDLNEEKSEERFQSHFNRCLNGTVYELYRSNRFWDINKNSQVTFYFKGENRIAKVILAEPPITYIGSVELVHNSNRLLSREAILKWFKFNSGDPVNTSAIREFGNKVYSHYYDQGYLAVNLELDSDSYVSKQTGLPALDLRFTLYEGEPFVISKIEFYRPALDYSLPDERITEKVLSDALGMNVGDIYSEAKLQQGIERLNKLGNFQISNSRQPDRFAGSSGSSTNIDVRENFETNTVEINISIYEPY